jgi:hypothetical protein
LAFICTTPTESVTPLQDAPFVASTAYLSQNLSYESLVLLRSCLLTWGMLDLMSQIIPMSWEHYFVLVCTFCSLHYRTTIRNMLGLKPFLIGKAVAIWCRMVSGLFSSFFYTRYIRVYLLEYMLYTKVNFIGDPAHWLADQYLAGIVTLAQTY